MPRIDDTSCCGLYELYELTSNPSDSVSEVGNHLFYSGEPVSEAYPFIVFSDTTENGNGEKLVQYIKKNDLGTVVATRARKNPSSGNMLKVYVWSLNAKNIKKHWSKLCKAYSDDTDDDDYYW